MLQGHIKIWILSPKADFFCGEDAHIREKVALNIENNQISFFVDIFSERCLRMPREELQSTHVFVVGMDKNDEQSLENTRETLQWIYDNTHHERLVLTFDFTNPNLRNELLNHIVLSAWEQKLFTPYTEKDAIPLLLNILTIWAPNNKPPVWDTPKNQIRLTADKGTEKKELQDFLSSIKQQPCFKTFFNKHSFFVSSKSSKKNEYKIQFQLK